MRTFTITFHHSNNYGAILQAYALQQTILALGHENIIFEYPYEERFYGKIHVNDPILSAKVILLNILKFFRKRDIKKRQNSFKLFHERQMCLSRVFYSMDDLRNNYPDCDALITGSDQVWRFSGNKEFIPARFLDFGKPGIRKFSYAASIEKLDYTAVQKMQVEQWLKGYRGISLREESATKYIREITGYDAQTVLDPVFLLDKEEWLKIARPPRIKEKYILCYQVQSSPTMQKTVDILRKKTGYKTVAILPYTVKWLRTDYALFDVSPEEFLGLFNSAEIVVSASFHGTAFGHIFGKTVYANIREESSNRIVDIMKLLGVPQYCVWDARNIMWPEQYNHDAVKQKLEIERKQSLDYLRACLLEE